MNQSISDEAVYRTAPATPGLLNMEYGDDEYGAKDGGEIGWMNKLRMVKEWWWKYRLSAFGCV